MTGEQGVMNHAPTGAAVVKIDDHAWGRFNGRAGRDESRPDGSGSGEN